MPAYPIRRMAAEPVARERLIARIRGEKKKFNPEQRAAYVDALIAQAGGAATDAYLILTHSELTTREQAAALGVTRSLVTNWRRQLTARGQLDPEERASHQLVTARERATVARLYADGYTASKIAELRGISPFRVRRIVIALPEPPTREKGYSKMALEVMLGLPERTMNQVIRHGLLIGERLTPGEHKGNRWKFTRADVVDLLRERRAWPVLVPGAIQDAELATFLRREQAAAAGNWYTREELRTILGGVDDITMQKWLRRGLLADAERCDLWRPARYLWLSHRDAEQLRELCAPIARINNGGDRGRCRMVADAIAHIWPALWAAYGTHQQAAAAD
jgi:transposase-like protein